MKEVLSYIVLSCFSLLAGCGSFTGTGPIGHGTTVTLESANFQVVKSNVVGTASVNLLFPMDTPIFGTLGLMLGDAQLQSRALKELRSQFPEEENAENLALVNITVDEKLVHYMLFGTKTLTITADIVKFE